MIAKHNIVPTGIIYDVTFSTTQYRVVSAATLYDIYAAEIRV
jgi:hypothetical protein